MTAGFMLVTISDVVWVRIVKKNFAHARLACLVLFQSMLTKIMFAPAVLCSSGPVPCSVAADDVNADHADDIALLVEELVKRKLKHGSSNCLSRSRCIRCLG